MLLVLNLVPVLKQKIISIMGNNKEINIKNRYCYFFNDMINIKIFYSNLLKIDKKSCKNISIYYIGYFTSQKTDDYENI